MPTLSNPKLQLQSTAGSGLVKVTTSVIVKFNDSEEHIIKCLNLKFKLACRIWSEDDVFNGGDDPMFALSTKTITKDGTYTFERTVPTSMLDEDWEGNDEFYAKFALQAIAFPMGANTRTSTQVGNY